MDLIDKYLGEAMTKDQYKEMLMNTQEVAQKAEKDYKRFVSLMKKKNIMDYATEIQRLVKGFQAITYGTIFDYPLRQGGFGDYLASVSSASMAAKEIKDMQTRIANFEKWRKTSPTQRKMF